MRERIEEIYRETRNVVKVKGIMGEFLDRERGETGMPSQSNAV